MVESKSLKPPGPLSALVPSLTHTHIITLVFNFDHPIYWGCGRWCELCSRLLKIGRCKKHLIAPSSLTRVRKKLDLHMYKYKYIYVVYQHASWFARFCQFSWPLLSDEVYPVREGISWPWGFSLENHGGKSTNVPRMGCTVEVYNPHKH